MEIKSVAVIGAGTMGQGIAQWFFEQGLRVYLIDQNSVTAKSAHQNVVRRIEKRSSALLGKISENFLTIEMKDLPGNTDLVVEAIFEDLSKKRELLKKLDQFLFPATVFASNTSSFSITELAQDLSISRKTQFLGLHFFNPAPVMKLVEVISGLETDKFIAQYFMEWLKSLGKVPCHCADSPGFLVNRIARHFYGESLRSAGTLDKKKFQEIDGIMKKVGGFKMGPFELMDLIGIDINLKVTESIYRSFYYEPRFRPHRLQEQLFSANHLGKKTGRGFYYYEQLEHHDRGREKSPALWTAQQDL